MPRLQPAAVFLGLCWLVGCGSSPTSPTTRLTITCPTSIDAQTPHDRPVAVSFVVPAAQGGSPPVQVICSPASGAEFPKGATSVTCTAIDARVHTASCAFIVTVTSVPRIALTRLLAFGDSITAGTISPAPMLRLFAGPPHSYPFKLRDVLATRYTQQSIIMVNAGVPRELASDGGVRRLPSELVVNTPEVLLLMEGTNDLFMYQEAGIPIGIAALEQMVQDGRRSGARVFLATIPPQRRGGARDRVARIIPQFNDEVRALAIRQSVVLVDVFVAIEPDLPRLIGIDDLHPTEEGNQVIARTFFAAIQANLEAVQTAAFHVR